MHPLFVPGIPIGPLELSWKRRRNKIQPTQTSSLGGNGFTGVGPGGSIPSCPPDAASYGQSL